jgi:triacylglycerol esterase/lipase EstA (alpha/beta hydrolase family)
MAGRQRFLLAVVAAAALMSGTAAALAAGRRYAPLDRPGPRLSVSARKLHAALDCTKGIRGARRDPILLVPGTDLTPRANYSWNYERAFDALHWAYCTVALPERATGNIETAGEYIVYAIRRMAHESRRRVDILGYSQGGMVPRWALRFWPDTRHLVKVFVALDPSNHGTVDANAACQSQCSAADWQQAAGSHFMRALNSFAETFAGIDYTVIYSRTDEIVVPNLNSHGSSSLHTGRGRIENIAVQQICPGDVSDHLAMGSYDPVGYALAVDALRRGSLANPKDVPAATCAQHFQPGVDPASFPSHYESYLEEIGRAQLDAKQLRAEPVLKCYVFDRCARSQRARSR